MTPIEPSDTERRLYRARFAVGDHTVICEMSPQRYMECLDRVRKRDPQSYQSPFVEQRLKEIFIDHMRPLTYLRTDDLNTLLHHGHTLYLLDAHGHGKEQDRQWRMQLEQGDRYQKRIAVHLQQLVQEEGIDAAILTPCNEQQVPFGSTIPALYSTKISTMFDFNKHARLLLPDGCKQHDGTEKVLPFLDGLCELKKSVDREKFYPQGPWEEFLKGDDIVYAKVKERVERGWKKSKEYNPRHVQKYDGVTFTTSSGTDCTIQNGCVQSRLNPKVDGLEIAVIGALTEREREKYEKPIVLDTKEGKADLIRHLRRPNCGLCLFFGYSLSNLSLERLMNTAPETFTPPIIGINLHGEKGKN